MKQVTKKQEQGFTIIEVVLVLAIAGLIFLIVFLALPQLQRSRRDTARKNDAGRFLSALENYAGNNSGTYPPTDQVDGFVDAYITVDGGTFDDPSTGEYTISTDVPDFSDPDVAAVPEGTLVYLPSHSCASGGVDASAGDRVIAVLVHQESGGQYCEDNQ